MAKTITGTITFFVEIEVNDESLSVYEYADELDYKLPDINGFKVKESRFYAAKQN